MITYLVTMAHAYTVNAYLDSWGHAWRERLRVVPYGQALLPPRLRRWSGRTPLDAVRSPGTWVFSDLERLSPTETEAAVTLWDRLSGAGIRCLNHPGRTMRRYELLRTLAATGRNDFDVFRADEGRLPTRWPVFLRGECDHRGSRTPLLPDADALASALSAWVEDRSRTLVVEFLQTVDPGGAVRKYSSFRVGERILPRHLFFSSAWQVKAQTTTHYTPECRREEEAYVATNPHGEALRAIFDLAHVEYGRIDYALRQGRVQVFEINTNPMILTADHRTEPERRLVHEPFAAAFDAALRALP